MTVELADEIDFEFGRRTYPDIEATPDQWMCKKCLRNVIDTGMLIWTGFNPNNPISYTIKRWIVKFLFKVQTCSWSNAYEEARRRKSDEAKS